MPDALLTTEQAAAHLTIPARTLSSWRSRNPDLGPPFARLGGTVRYRRSDLDAWVEKRIVGKAS